MLTLGIDPGTRLLGWGLVQRTGSRLTHVAHGVIRTDVAAPLGGRLVQIERELTDLIAQFRPGAGAIEDIFFQKDPRAAAKLGHARGVALLVLSRVGLDVGEYPPARVKLTVTGRGQAEKGQVAEMVRTMLSLPELPQGDASDALAVAITHARLKGLSLPAPPPRGRKTRNPSRAALEAFLASRS